MRSEQRNGNRRFSTALSGVALGQGVGSKADNDSKNKRAESSCVADDTHGRETNRKLREE